MTKLAVAIFHGIGTHPSSFANPLIEEVRRRLTVRFPEGSLPEIVYRPIHWGTVLDSGQTELFDRMCNAEKLGWQSWRSAIIAGLGDAIAYHPLPDNCEIYDQVHARVAAELSELAAEAGADAPLCVIAHSFGSILACNYFHDRQRGRELTCAPSTHVSPLMRGESLCALITLGSPLALWSLRFHEYGSPLQIPAVEMLQQYPEIEGTWLNLYDPNDILGFPLRPLNPSYEEAVIDFPIKVGGLFSSWSPLAHFGYWNNETVLSVIAANLSILWQQGKQSCQTMA